MAAGVYAFFTLPSTEKFYIITGIEWKNGGTVAGNVVCGVDLVDANPPTLAGTVNVAVGTQIAQSGTSAVHSSCGRCTSRKRPDAG